jgi:hypothetical protein
MPMTETVRIPRPDVISLLHITIGGIFLSEGQQFYKTPKTWELWQETPFFRRITFWRDSSIPGVMYKENSDD